MPEIKVRDTVEGGIKTLDKPKIIRDKVGKPGFRELPKKDSEGTDLPTDTTTDNQINDPKGRAAHAPVGDLGKGKEDDSSVVAYADSKLRSGEEKLYRLGKNTVKAVVRKAVSFPKETGTSKSKNPKPDKDPVKTRNTPPPKTSGNSVKTNPSNIKVSQSGSKTSGQAAKKSATQAEKTIQKAKKRAERAERVRKIAKETAKRTVRIIKTTVRSVIAALRGLAALLGTSVGAAVIVILVICLIGLIVGSCFGIFFSGEDTGTGQSVRTAVQEINREYMSRIDEIKASTTHDKVEMSGSRAAWKEVLSIYSVSITTDEENPQEAASMTDEKKILLSDIFWNMHTINHSTQLRTETEFTEGVDENGELITVENEVERNYLLIQVSHKTAIEMADHYGFTNDQKEQLNELLLPENQSMWNDVLYGLAGQGDLVAVALSQVGNVGGETYWKWYGFDERVDWCAIFVSWCANECGYLENGVIPSFAVCYAGEDWFKAREQWQDNTYTPNPGDIIFFDWDYPDEGGQDGIPNHVGIVEKVENGIVYTIEGNSGDSCRQKSYAVGYYEIYGYGALCP